MTSWSNDERRRMRRIPLNVEVMYTSESRYKKVEVMEGEMVNITEGEGGVCIKMTEQVGRGDSIMLKITLPNEKDLFTTGKIMWVKESDDSHYLAGLRFDFDEEDMEYIRNVISDC